MGAKVGEPLGGLQRFHPEAWGLDLHHCHHHDEQECDEESAY